MAGGNASGPVVRVGNTVRKPWSATAPAVTAYVDALASAGIDVPKPLGRDDAGRQVIEYVPGTLAEERLPLGVDDLARVGRMVRAIHDASAGIPIPEPGEWAGLLPAPGADLICHNDLAPWNLIVGERWVFIDWDASAPSTRLWDLAYAAQAFTLNDPDRDVGRASTDLAALVDGYGADEPLRAALPRTMGDRTAAMYDLLERSLREGFEPWATMYAEGHGAHWRTAMEYVRRHEGRWRAALGVS